MRRWPVISLGIIVLSAVSSVAATGQVRFDPRPDAIVVRVGVEPLTLCFGVLLHASDSKDDLDLKAAYRDYLRVMESIRHVGGKARR